MIAHRFLLQARAAALLFMALAAALAAQVLDLRLTGAGALYSGAALPPRLAAAATAAPFLELEARFQNDALYQRACWDFVLNEDLTHCAGIALRIKCRNAHAVRQFSLYIQADKAWQTVPFSLKAGGAWQDIFIPKAAFLPEKQTASWKNATMMRLALWRGVTATVTVSLARAEFVRPNGRVAIVRTGLNGPRNTAAFRAARDLNQALNLAGILPAVIEENDITFISLAPYTFLFLPNPEDASPEQLVPLVHYIRRGGKAAVFHTVPPILQQAMRLPLGKFTRTADLLPNRDVDPVFTDILVNPRLLPNARNFIQPSASFIAVPKVSPPVQPVATWKNLPGTRHAWPAILESPMGFWMTHAYLGKDNRNAAHTFAALAYRYLPKLRETAVKTLCDRTVRAYYDAPAPARKSHAAGTAVRNAIQACRNANLTDTVRYCEQAAKLLEEAEADIPVVRDENEVRAVWSANANGLPTHTWDTTARLLKSWNFNALFVQAASPLLTAYNSQVAPFISGKNSLASASAAARKYGLRFFPAIQCLSVEDAATTPALKNKVDDWAAEGRLQINEAGQTIRWLCPVQRRNRSMLVRLVSELVHAFPMDGICLDFIRYASSQTCCCRVCRDVFTRFIGNHPVQWPDDIRQNGKFHRKWLAFRESVITTLVQEIAGAAQKSNNDLLLTAAVFPVPDHAKRQVGQNWPAWLKNDLISLACPMAYHETTDAFRATLTQIGQTIGAPFQSLLMPLIGVSPANLTAPAAKHQIAEALNRKTAGVILYKLDISEAQNVLPFLFR